MKSTSLHNILHEYVGVIHIHSTYSDGSKTIPEIARIAAEVQLDFLMFTDHNTLQPKRDGFENWYDGVLVAIGYEINDESDRNHYLAFNLENELDPALQPAEYVKLVQNEGGFGIIAHPDEKRNAMKNYPAYPWNYWESEHFDGIEIWNQMSEWMEGLNHFNKFWRVFNPRRSIISPMPETLSRWDDANLHRSVVGIGGVDAHGYKYVLFGGMYVTIFRYKVLFKTIRTHVLTEKPLSGEGQCKNDIQNLYSGLQNCRCFISNYYCGDARGFRFWAENRNEFVWIGGEIKFERDTHFHVNLPQPGLVHLIHNGKKIASHKGEELVFEIPEPGIYRVEVYSFNRPWIFSNHIRVI